MSFYGNRFLNTGYFDISIEEFFNIMENDRVLMEDTLALPYYGDNSTETSKKKILDSIKDAFNKVAVFIKSLFEKFIKFVNEITDKINRDEIVKKIAGRDLSFKDLEDAKAKGWKGIPNSLPFSIIENDELFANKDLFETICRRLDPDKIINEIEKMKNIDELSEAKSKYIELVEKLDNIKLDRELFNRIERGHYTSQDKNPKDDRYYYLSIKIFEMIKKSSIDSRSIIRNIKDQNKKIIDKIRNEYIKPLEKEIEYNLNSTADNSESLKTYNYYLKTKVAYNNFILKNIITATNLILRNTKDKINENTKFYISLIKSVKDYLPNNTENKENNESENK